MCLTCEQCVTLDWIEPSSSTVITQKANKKRRLQETEQGWSLISRLSFIRLCVNFPWQFSTGFIIALHSPQTSVLAVLFYWCVFLHGMWGHLLAAARCLWKWAVQLPLGSLLCGHTAELIAGLFRERTSCFCVSTWDVCPSKCFIKPFYSHPRLS